MGYSTKGMGMQKPGKIIPTSMHKLTNLGGGGGVGTPKAPTLPKGRVGREHGLGDSPGTPETRTGTIINDNAKGTHAPVSTTVNPIDKYNCDPSFNKPGQP